LDAARVERLIVDVPTVRTDMESVLESENVGTGVEAELGSEVLVSERVKIGTEDVVEVVRKGATETDDVDAITVVELLENELAPAELAGLVAKVEDVKKDPPTKDVGLAICVVVEDVKKDPPTEDVGLAVCVVVEDFKKDPPPIEYVLEVAWGPV
jgi:hypothetical protein